MGHIISFQHLSLVIHVMEACVTKSSKVFPVCICVKFVKKFWIDRYH